MKSVILISIIFIISINLIYTQRDYNIQTWQKEIEQCINYSFEEVENKINKLKELIAIDDDHFGKEYQSIVNDYKNRAKIKIKEFEAWKRNQDKIKNQQDELNNKDEIIRKIENEKNISDIEQEKIIDSLRKIIKELDSKYKIIKEKFHGTNKELSTLKDYVASIDSLLEGILKLTTIQNENFISQETGIISKLEDLECQFINLLRQNYQLAVSKLMNNPILLDSLKEYYHTSKQYPDVILDLITRGKELINNINNDSSICVSKNTEIINKLISEVENLFEEEKPEKGNNILAYLYNLLLHNLLWIIILIIAILVLPTILFTSKVKLLTTYKLIDETNNTLIDSQEEIKMRKFSIPLKSEIKQMFIASYPVIKNFYNQILKKPLIYYYLYDKDRINIFNQDIIRKYNSILISESIKNGTLEFEDRTNNIKYKLEYSLDRIKNKIKSEEEL